ncbi:MULTISPECIES: HdeD family acid-resistance protein [Mesorhizobium]|uniref:HdeD family acid-resistance protein n=2 Tax=Phyllobacteriaceae TaxID=69277 RepID=UPI000FE642A6|nr:MULTISPECIES: HdeD family acid-resistance protein [Mesorhizobium]MDX8433320.1 HdeD family acid-resistance protein [Mesorhizobium abyssinicae]RWA60211.1 MAG: HdeD family acid-resistance protein [Mesorhizobium sp.]RWC95797.1 MAG: HdeD family acid-resistance protein [Mesorhizobium sp.]TGV23996.1 HdeD family acid-resistance protein [Mesorhizobium sp. M4B.F.Ca.ET.143.01.1.1]TIW73901.1 MAG: HdeD family acid-resistance protein [Mesorhizobium sp.]
MSLQGDALKDAIGRTRDKWGWFVALGVLLLIFGGIAFGNLLIATVASVYLVGWMMLMAGVIEIIHAFGVKTWGRFLYWLASGLLYAVAGFFAFDNPALASAVLTLLLAASLVASGVLRAWVGFHHRPEKGWGWLVAAGVISALAGLVIAMGWPVNSLWVLGLFLAIDLVFQGWSFIAIGLALKR